MALKVDGQNNSYEVALAQKLQLQLTQPMSDIQTKLTNRDFEGDFFKIGDTVSIVKPDIDSIAVDVGAVTDERMALGNDIDFEEKMTLKIDKSSRYGFFVSDVNKAEGKWNYESLGLAVAGHKIRRKKNVELCDLIANDATIKRLGTPAAPLTCTSVDDLYSKVLLPMYLHLYNTGAIAADGSIPMGSNPVEGKASTAGVFMPTDGIAMLLQSKYLTDRSTTQADQKVETANVGKVLGMDVAIEPALAQDSAEKITVDTLKPGAFVVIAGTSNTVTEASKVLPPERFRSHSRFGDEFHGLEVYGRKVVEKDAAIVAFVEYTPA
nr:MAG TPA: Major capsid protein [Caudoviricetes sp.]